MFGFAIIMCFIFRMHLIALNKRLDEGEEIYQNPERRAAVLASAKLEGIDEAEALRRAKGFRYVY